MEAFAYYALVSLVVLVMAAPAVITFMHGWRRTYLDQIPLGALLFFSFGFALLNLLMDWIWPNPADAGVLERLAWATVVFVIGSLLWIAGMLAGRWWRNRQDGTLAGR